MVFSSSVRGLKEGSTLTVMSRNTDLFTQSKRKALVLSKSSKPNSEDVDDPDVEFFQTSEQAIDMEDNEVDKNG